MARQPRVTNTSLCAIGTPVSGAALPAARPLDGKSLLPLLTGKTSRHIDTFYWSEGGAAGGFAIRSGDWKLVQQRSQPKVELFHLAKDPAETTDLAPQNAAKVAELSKLYDTWLDQMAEPMDGVGKRLKDSSGPTKKEKKKRRTLEPPPPVLPVEPNVTQSFFASAPPPQQQQAPAKKRQLVSGDDFLALLKGAK